MNRGVFIVLILVGALGGYAIMKNLSRTSSLPQKATTTESGAVEVRTKELNESSEAYDIRAKYPVFGVEAFDARIKVAIDEAISGLKGVAVPEMDNYKNSLDTTFADTYVGQDYLSVKLILAQYTGGAHPMTIVSGLNFDRSGNRVTTLEDALTLIGLSVQELSDKASKELRDEFGKSFFEEGAYSNPENFSSFAIGKDEVTFIFQPYQVAAYAEGVQEVSFPRIK